jgi:DNA-directed RNA polymerase specialized sigma24 family protein
VAEPFWRQRLGHAESLDSDGDEIPAWTMNWDDYPAGVTIGSESISIVKDAFWKPPCDLRTAVLPYEYEGLLYEGVSAVLRCRVKPTEMKLYRARKGASRKPLASSLR